jgi:hypothetical protein
MTARAAAGTIEVRLARLRVADERGRRVDQRATLGGFESLVQKLRDVRDLLIGQTGKGWHGRRPTDMQKRRQLLALRISEDDERASQIGSASASARVVAVAKTALRFEYWLRAFDRRSVERWSSTKAPAGGRCGSRSSTAAARLLIAAVGCHGHCAKGSERETQRHPRS